MTTGQQQRLATAVGFLSGVLATMNALRDAKVLWPPDVVWGALRSPQRLELGGGIALIIVTFVISLVRQSSAHS
jgi:hypothetical protein